MAINRYEEGNLFKYCSLNPNRSRCQLLGYNTRPQTKGCGLQTCHSISAIDAISQDFKLIWTAGRMQHHPTLLGKRRQVGKHTWVCVCQIHLFHARVCIFHRDQVCTLQCTPHLPCEETWLSSDQLSSLITAKFAQTGLTSCLPGRLPVSGEGGGHASGMTGLL